MLIHDPVDLVRVTVAHCLSKSVVVPLEILLPPLLQEQRSLVASGGIPDHPEESEHPPIAGPLEGNKMEAPVRPGKPRYVVRRDSRLHLRETLVESKEIRLRKSRNSETMSFRLEQGAQPVDLGRLFMTKWSHADVASRTSLEVPLRFQVTERLPYRNMADAEARCKDLRRDSLARNESPFDQVLAD